MWRQHDSFSTLIKHGTFSPSKRFVVQSKEVFPILIIFIRVPSFWVLLCVLKAWVVIEVFPTLLTVIEFLYIKASCLWRNGRMMIQRFLRLINSSSPSQNRNIIIMRMNDLYHLHYIHTILALLIYFNLNDEILLQEWCAIYSHLKEFYRGLPGGSMIEFTFLCRGCGSNTWSWN